MPTARGASELYAHYTDGSGADVTVDCEKAYRQDAVIRRAVGQEIQHGQKRAEIIEEMNKSSALDTTGCAVTVGNGNYPVMENWQKALGGHVMWRSGSVQVSGDTFAMKIVIHEKGRYDFNKGMRDIATGIPDDVNDCFATLGWAKPCMTRGTVTRTVTWTRGDIAGSSVVSGGERG